MSFSALVLAAGRGVRMHSNKAKVLHRVAGRPLLYRVLDAFQQANNVYVVTRAQETQLPQHLQNYIYINTDSLAHLAGRFVDSGFQTEATSLPNYYIVLQEKALGTADAVKVAVLPSAAASSAAATNSPETVQSTTVQQDHSKLTPFKLVRQDGVEDVARPQLCDQLVICNGDHPFIKKEDIQNAVQQHNNSGAAISVCICRVEEPGVLGRVILKGDQVHAIVEASEATPEQLKINTICTGLYVAQRQALEKLLPCIDNNNSKKEYYLTDIVKVARAQNIDVAAIEVSKDVALGVNTQLQLAQATRQAFVAKAYKLLDEGVQIVDPRHVYIEDTVQIAAGCTLYPNIYLSGHTRLAAGCVVEMGCQLTDTLADKNVYFRGGTYIQGAYIHEGSQLGPYTRVRQGRVDKNCQVGNFVEIKNTHLQQDVKAKHLSYLGDAEVGAGSNIGSSVVTCNYAVDRKKYKTQIGRDVFVGSGAQLVAPLHIGDRAVVGAGSVITKNIPNQALAVARSQQIVKKDYQVENKKQKE